MCNHSSGNGKTSLFSWQRPKHVMDWRRQYPLYNDNMWGQKLNASDRVMLALMQCLPPQSHSRRRYDKTQSAVSAMWEKLPLTASIIIITQRVYRPVKSYRGSVWGQASSSGGHDIMCGKICSARAGTRKQMSIFSWLILLRWWILYQVSQPSVKKGKKEEEEEENKKDGEERNSRCQQ